MVLLTHFFGKIQAILQTVQGWAIGTGVALTGYFAGHAFVCGLVAAVTLMDAVFGVWVSLRRGEFALSELARLTIDKLAVYGCTMFVFVGLDRLTDTTLTAGVVGAAIVLVEFWSSLASMMILYPHVPLLKLLRKALAGEIASKLKIDAGDVEQVLDGKKGGGEA